MKRDMELCRKILFQIEEEYISTALLDIEIDGYSMEEVAYHCNILCDAGLLKNYSPLYANSAIANFAIGPLTWEGHEFLDKIREDTVWNRTKSVITSKGLPMILDVVKDISTAIITSATEGAVKVIMKGGV